jgi:predicted GIY-YIG superfamily endonuclease/2-polyprenyl-3-methyl-5-hydroxy-6-metoxy-1,4-benzoquinol methylase
VKPFEPTGGWESVYRDLSHDKIPWNAGGPDSDLVALLKSGRVPEGQALDLGCGLGYDAVEMARAGFRVLAIDLSETAIKHATERAEKAGLSAVVDFVPGDVLTFQSVRGAFSLVHDRGFFHVLEPGPTRKKYVALAANALSEDGLFVLRVFSDKEPAGPGPFRLSKKELKKEFGSKFTFVEIRESILEGPRKPHTYFCILKKKVHPYRRMLNSLKAKAKNLTTPSPSKRKTAEARPEQWSVYVVRCSDDSLYTGVAKDAAARIAMHNSGKGAAYTRTRRPVELLYREDGYSRSEALVREAAIKSLSREKKRALAGLS